MTKKRNALREFDMQPWYQICLNYRKKTTTNADIIVKQFFFITLDMMFYNQIVPLNALFLKNTLLQPIIYDYYIRKPETIKYQKYIPRFRLSLQQLAIIETGRSDNCEQQNRKCFLFSYFVENKSYLNMSFKRSITLNHQKILQCRNSCGILMLKMLKMYALFFLLQI